MTITEAIDLLVCDTVRPEDIAAEVHPTELTIAVHCLQDAQRIQRERTGPFAMLAAECERRAALLAEADPEMAIEVRDLAAWCRARADEDSAWKEEP